MITSDTIKQLRDKTGISVMQCKKALEASDGDIAKAVEFLKRKGTEMAAKKSDRELGAGVIATYIHSDKKLGVMVELLCETDFVARNEDFVRLADDIALQVAAMHPLYVKVEDISEADREKARAAFAEEIAKMDKPEEIKQKVLAGKIETYFAERVLMSQPFVKECEKTVADLLTNAVQKMGEKIDIGRFKRFALLEDEA